MRDIARDRKRFGNMAISLCLRCGRKIDDRVEQCPYCEAPRREDAKFFQELLARLAKSRRQPYYAGTPKA
jgi:rubrerythrin